MSVISSRLQDVVDAFIAEVSAIEGVFHASSGAVTVSSQVIDYDPIDDGCVVSLWDSWNRFMRALLLSSCSSVQITGASGHLYCPALALTEAQAVTHLVQVSRSRSNSVRSMAGEPSWYDLNAIYDMTQELQLANSQQIVTAVTSSAVSLGAGFVASNPIEEIRAIRNFIAHKGNSSLSRARRYMSSHVTAHTHDLQLGGVTRFSQWVDSLAAIAETAAA